MAVSDSTNTAITSNYSLDYDINLKSYKTQTPLSRDIYLGRVIRHPYVITTAFDKNVYKTILMRPDVFQSSPFGSTKICFPKTAKTE